MLRLLRTQLDANLIKISLIFALIYCILFNSAVLIYKFNYYRAAELKAVLELSKDFIYIYLSLFIIFFGLTINRFIFIAGTICLFLTGALASYYLYFFQIAPTAEIMHAFFGTEPNEIYELVSIRLIIWLIFSLFIGMSAIKHFGVSTSNLFVTKLLSAICILLMFNSIIAPQYKILNSYFPIQYLHNTYLYFFQDRQSSPKADLSRKFTFIDNSAEEIVGVLVIGESARYDHLGINGYARPTTPHLSSIDHLFSYKAQSSSNLTYSSVPCMLSRYSAANLDKTMTETSFVPVLNKFGFDTYWIGTQSLMKYYNNVNLGTIYNEVGFAFIPGGSTLLKTSDHDQVMMPHIKHVLSKAKKQFLIIHTNGSHWHYAARYPQEFRQFTPSILATSRADPQSYTQEELVNTYDNSILYTDFFLHNVVNLLNDKIAFLIYASDHGESLGEGGRYCHGGQLTAEQTTIPFLVWVSDKFKAQYPDMVTALGSHLGNEISHDYIFHSVLDGLGLSSDIINQNLSLFNQRKND